MAAARSAWGIDIGNRALKAVKLVRDGDTVRIDDFDVIEHENVLSNAGDNRDELVRSALATFVQRHPAKKGGVVSIGVAGQASFARFIKLPPVEEKKIPEIVRFEAIQQIPFPLDEVEWSYQLFRSPETPDVEVGIFAMRKDLIARHISQFTEVDLNTQVVQMNPLAVYNAVYFDQRVKQTTMVIDLGAENTDLIICDENSVWMRSIPIGGNNFTETLVKAFKLPFAKAEDLKRNAATSKYARQIFQAMRPVFADLVAEIQRSLGFYGSVHRESTIEKVLAIGGTFKLPGLQKYLQQNLSMDVERIDTLGAGAPADPKQAAAFNENLLSMVGAYGLALQAVGEGKITSSLLPAYIRREKIWRDKVPIFAATAACFVVGSALAFGGYVVQNAAFEKASDTRSHIASVQNRGDELDKKWSEIESSGAPDRATMSNILGLMKYRDVWQNLLHDVGASAPKPQPQVADGIAQSNADLVKQVARNQRNLLTIETVQSRYMADLGPVLNATPQDLGPIAAQVGSSGNMSFASPAGALMGPMGEEGAQPGAPAAAPAAGAAGAARGFLVVIKGTTPNGNGHAFIRDGFCKALAAIGPSANAPSLNYAMKRAEIVKSNFLRENPERLTQMQSKFTELENAVAKAKTGAAGSLPGGGGFNPGFGTPGGAMGGDEENPGFRGPGPGFVPGGTPVAGQPTVDQIAPFRDRLTGEDMRDDTEFTIVLAVQVDPPAYTPPAPAAGASPAASAQ